MFVTTIGIVPVPEANSGVGLVLFLEAARSGACDLTWISSPGICNSLAQKLTAASAALARGDTVAAKDQLGAFRNELDAQRGKHVSENAYWLLRPNATWVVAHL